LRRAPARLRHALLVAALVACAVVPWFRSAAAEPPLLAPEPRAVAPATALLDAAANVIAVLYLLGLAYSGASLLVAARRARGLRANTIDPPPTALEALAICSRALGRTAPLRCSSRVTVPVTIGSTILLPAEPLPDDALLPVIGHELAHVRRRDALLQVLLKLITLPVAFHPLVRMLERRVAVAREIACDELVVSSLVEPRRYAQTLLSIAERCAAPQPALAFGHADALKLRLLSLRDISAKRRWLGA